MQFLYESKNRQKTPVDVVQRKLFWGFFRILAFLRVRCTRKEKWNFVGSVSSGCFTIITCGPYFLAIFSLFNRILYRECKNMRRKIAIFHSGRFFEFCIIMQYSILSRTFNLLFLPVLCHFSLPILVLHDEGAVRGFPYQILTVFFNRKIYIKFLSLHDRCPHVFFYRLFTI